jgi:hypothetical protein
MTPRRRLPYAAGGLIDQVKMDASSTIRLLMPLVECKPLSVEERVSLPARAVLNLRNMVDMMNEIRELVEPEVQS